MKKMTRLLTMTGLLITALAMIIGCTTQLPPDTPAAQEPEVRQEKVLEQEAVSVPEQPKEAPVIEQVGNLNVPEGYYDTGIVTFSGETSLWEIAAGIKDPSVKGVEVLAEWHQIEPEEGVYDWSLIDDAIELWGSQGKYVTIRLVSANQNTHITPGWFFDDYKVRRIAAGRAVNFERKPSWYVIGDAGERTKDKSLVLDRMTSLHNTGKGLLFETKKTRLDAGKKYGLQFDYSIIEDGEFTLAIESKQGGAEETQTYTFSGTVGTKALESWSVQLGPYPDYQYRIYCDSGEIVIDNLAIHEITQDHRGNVGFPNYFDPVFKEKWTNVVTAMAQRYNPNPHVDTIVVTGYGRWGEINLEGEKVGERDEQWLWVKWSEEKYLDHIEWAAHLFKGLFPEKTQRMVSGGFSIASMTDQELLYWRTINMCNELSIQMKINGLQEGAGIWPEQMFTYGAHRFKNEPEHGIVYETAGQIYRNITGVDGIPTGHPITLINRALIDGADILYLYGPDILSRNVNKHFHYMTEQMGSEVFTKIYNLHGLYNTANETWRPAPIGYTDIWNGIYHTKWTHSPIPHRHPVAYDIIDGRHVIMTTDERGSGILEYDIDSRLRYNGMYGAIFHVTYLDQGTDSFSVKIDDHTAEMLSLGTIEKTDSMEWVTKSFPVTPWLQSKRNTGEDDHVIMVLDDLDDGTETIHAVEIDYVPAREWKTETIFDTGISSAYTQVPDSLELIIDLDPVIAPSVAFVDIPLWTTADKNERKNALYTVYGTIDGEEVQITEKSYYWGRDGNIVPLPVASGKSYDSLRVVMETPRGELGWYVAENGEPAYALRSYSSEPQRFETIAADGEFSLLKPAAAVSVSQTLAGTLTLQRMIDSTWTNVSEGLSEHEGTICFEPQTQGRYRIIDESGNTVSGSMTPRYLARIAAPKPALPFRHDRALLEWTPEELITEGMTEMDGYWYLDGTEASLSTEEKISIDAGKNDAIEFTIGNETSSSFARCFWMRDTDTDYSYERSVLIPIVSNDPTMRDYRYNVGEHPLWEGEIVSVRLQPVTGTLDAGVFALDRVAVTSPEVLYAWDFASSADRFFRQGRTEGILYEDGKLIIDGSLFARISSMPNSPNIWADRDQKIEIIMKNQTDSDIFDISWNRELRDEFNATHTFGSAFTTVEISTHDEEFKIYTIDCDAVDGWDGFITDLELIFYNSEAEDIVIDSIRIIAD